VLGKNTLAEVKLAYIGDSNNVANSLMLMAAILAVDFTLVTPVGYEPSAEILLRAQELAMISGSQFRVTSDINTIGKQDVIYTDTWISMGNEDQRKKAEILAHFAPYQVNYALMSNAEASIVLHCQPAHLEQEITTELFDSNLSKVFQQAENRMWAQNAVLVTLLGE
jgi:ornithine carbamoyltransferase